MNNDMMRLEDLVNNPTARVPICLCLDVSGSMDGEPIRELNEGIRIFYDAIRGDETALYAAEICIVAFGGNRPECIVDFATVEYQGDVAMLDANGGTPMGEAVNMGLDLLDRRKNEYKDKGVDYFQPWLVLMTDGQPNGDSGELSRAINRTVKLVNDKKLVVFPIGIGNEADMDTLRKFSPNRTPMRLKGLHFKEFFQWLSQSVSRTSQSMPGEKVSLPPITDSDGGWGELA